MRVLVTTSAVNSHLYNLVPTAWALRAAGHEVCVATQPNLIEETKRTGLTAVAVGEELPTARGNLDTSDTPYGLGVDITETDPATLTLPYVREVFRAYTSVVCEYMAGDSMLSDLVDFARVWRPDLVLWDAHNYAAPVMARAADLPHVRIIPAPDHWARMRAIFLDLVRDDPAAAADDPLADYLGGKLARYGREFDEEMVVGQATLEPIPTCLRVRADVDYRPVRHVPYSGPSVIPAWLRRKPKRRRVCLTLGQTRRALGPAESDDSGAAGLLSAIADLDVEVIATLNASQIPPGTPIPDNVRLFDYVPLNALLPTCAAVVHLGGMGTVNAAVVHGVPQVGMPGNIWGEAGIMREMAARGAALVAEPGNLVAQLARVLDEPSFTDAATQLRKEMLATPSPRDIVPDVEEIAGARAKGDGDGRR
ncbi:MULTISPECIES: activator-dependent family glycosyltransferase [unclassified Solwaraspora]|uniref:activator-dependent family glycosyltransferase n=2 Tax=Solwaraspora TaxID=265431 RepID=UPI00248AD98F|nr:MULTISPECIES: activator-dependent family glycosyltransferase [unclassified Solwaraspora]WBB98286.1 activator-dependent family glycosyltransferase [Solwaraspora sp. WMMA2059]WBC23160.1 activator-dependent family glycosyltransferase [Solwaraspora sp. WMMA2080]WJK34773.1 activator-dependent family glycosyltransferase [Solwaraspora sp. WMMA2065]